MLEDGNKTEENGEAVNVSKEPLILLFVGLSVLIAGIAVITVASTLEGGSSSFGGVIFIGPFPIVFGAGPDAAWLVTLSIIIAVLMFVLFFVLRRKS